jgi:hypothetical protein
MTSRYPGKSVEQQGTTRVYYRSCQVLQDPAHFSFLLDLCELSAARFSNSFSYTLLDDIDFQGL